MQRAFGVQPLCSVELYPRLGAQPDQERAGGYERRQRRRLRGASARDPRFCARRRGARRDSGAAVRGGLAGGGPGGGGLLRCARGPGGRLRGGLHDARVHAHCLLL